MSRLGREDFSKLLQTDEMRVTLNGSDGRVPGWISNGPRAPLRLRSARWRWGTDMDCYYLRWANWTFSGWRWTQNQLPNLLPVFRRHFISSSGTAKKGLRLSRRCLWFLCMTMLHRIRWKNHDMAPLLTCPRPYWEPVGPSSMGDLQWRELVHLSEQLHSVGEAVVAAGRKVDGQQMTNLTDSVNGRFVSVIEKKGGCMNVFLYVFCKFWVCLFFSL